MAKLVKKVAFFDIDGTIFRSSLFIELVDSLILKGVFPKEARHIFEKPKIKWLDRHGDYEEYIMAVVEAFMKHLRGVHYGVFAETSKEVAMLNKSRTYVYTINLLKELKKKGYYLVAISQSPKTILDHFSKPLGFDKVYGRVYETGPQGNFTGQIAELHLIANKANIVKRIIEKENLTLRGSIAVGDTEGDIPMLEMVEQPICFNPNNKLYKYARRLGWKIVIERKDVIYEL